MSSTAAIHSLETSDQRLQVQFFAHLSSVNNQKPKNDLQQLLMDAGTTFREQMAVYNQE